MTQIKRLFVISGKERGFTLAEVIVAMAIISFVVLATWRVITSSLHSITRQDQKVKALHISQAHLARLEAETFSRVVPETWRIRAVGAEEEYYYQLSIYNQNISSDKIFITPDSDYWYDDGDPDTESLGFDLTNQDKDDGILVADKNGNIYWRTTSSLSTHRYQWELDSLRLTFSSDDKGQEVQIYYCYYHLIDEGATIPSSDGEARKKGVIRLVTDPGELNGHAKNIAVEEIESGDSIAPDEYSSSTRKLFF